MISANNRRPVNTGIRLAAMLLDHIIMTIIAMIFFLPSMISGFSNAFNVSHEQTRPVFMEGPVQYITIFGFALYLCKDVIDGRSIAKRILKLQVVDNSTGKVASSLKCFVRNIFCIIWPIEVIVALINPGRRLGDRVAGTKLVYYDITLQQPKVNVGKIILPLILSYGIMLLILQLLPKVETAKVNYSKTSYNKTESKELEQLFSDRLGQLATPDIRVYDTVKNKNLKYISIILRLKQNFIADGDTYQQVHEISTNLIYSKFPKETFTGRIQYAYQGNGQFQSRETSIGTEMYRRK